MTETSTNMRIMETQTAIAEFDRIATATWRDLCPAASIDELPHIANRPSKEPALQKVPLASKGRHISVRKSKKNKGDTNTASNRQKAVDADSFVKIGIDET